MAIIPVHSGDNLQTKINSAAAGDILELDAGATWDGAFSLPNTASTSAALPIMIRSSAYASLPNGRVSPSDAAHMPRVRTTTSSPVFVTATNANNWILDGLEITDNITTTSVVAPSFLDFGNANTGATDITVQRCYIHQKEADNVWVRYVIRATQFEGKGFTYKWNYIGPIQGYYHVDAGTGTNQRLESSTLLCVGANSPTTSSYTGNPILIQDNYLNAWWNTVFLGGADTSAFNTANLTSATTGSASFDNTTGLAAGVVIRFELHGTGTLSVTGLTSVCAGMGGTWPATTGEADSGAVLTRTSGVALTSGNIRHVGLMTNTGDSSSGLFGLCTVSGNTYGVAAVKSAFANAGTVNWVLYETAIVTSVSGSTVNYTPLGSDALASSGATTASWNYGDQGLISDVHIIQNTFYKNEDFAANVLSLTNNSPKGTYEFKNVNRLTVEGNYFTGYPSLCAHYPSNQYGTAPWITVRDVIFRNNWIDYILGYAESGREAISITSQNDYATISPSTNVEIYNNFVRGVDAFISGKGIAGFYKIYHNTVISNGSSAHGSHSTVKAMELFPTYEFRDNILSLIVYGWHCDLSPNGATVAECMTVGQNTWTSNVAVNTAGVTSADLSFACHTFNGSRLSPVYTDYSQVGFTNPAINDYSLSAGSAYKGLGTSGSDPGVVWSTLLAALPYSPLIGGGGSSPPSVKLIAMCT